MKQILCAALAVLVGACASVPASAPETASAEDRAQARWDAMLAGEWDTVYTYFTPGYRSSESAEEYAQRMGLGRVSWTKAQVRDSQCEEQRCEVRVWVEFTVPSRNPTAGDVPGVNIVTEVWLNTGSGWFHLPDRRGI